MVTRLFFLSICFPFLLTSCQQSKKTVEFVDYVNPLMGTESTFAFSHGNTYPAVAVPLGDELLESADGGEWQRMDVYVY